MESKTARREILTQFTQDDDSASTTDDSVGTKSSVSKRTSRLSLKHHPKSSVARKRAALPTDKEPPAKKTTSSVARARKKSPSSESDYKPESSDDNDHWSYLPRTSSHRSRKRAAAAAKTRGRTKAKDSKKPMKKKKGKVKSHKDDSDKDLKVLGVKKPGYTYSAKTPLDMLRSLRKFKEETNSKYEVSPTPVTNETMLKMGFFTSTSKPIKEQDICKGCGCRDYVCHERVYSRYCTKAVMSYVLNSPNNNYAGYDNESLKRVYIGAYREKRRVDLEESFSFFSSEWLELPNCMVIGSLQEACTLGFNTKLLKDLETHNNNAEARYNEAKYDHRI